MSLQKYHELFMAQVEVMGKVQVTMFNKGLAMEVAVRNNNIILDADDLAVAREQHLPFILFMA